MILIHFFGGVYAQESIFAGFGNSLQKADELYEASAYREAIDIYQSHLDNGNLKGDESKIILRIAASYYHLNDMANAVQWYQQFLGAGGKLTADEMLQFASALQGMGNYDAAIDWMQKYLALHPENFEVSKKIWQLQNISYLYEDSAFYKLQALPFNSKSDEFGPTLHNNTIIFASNRPEFSIVHRIDATTQRPFFSWYAVDISRDSTNQLHYSEPKSFASNIKAKYHKGRVSFNERADLMAFTRTSETRGKKEFTSKLFFAKKTEDGQWLETNAFPYNSDSYSILHPSFADEGNKLYFSSDMPGSIGGTDLYTSDFVDGDWTKPVNLGPEINSSQNEGYPYFHNGILYFSSNGHPGLGGLDIQKVNLSKKPLEVINLGYPINTHFDDFGLMLDSTGASGFMASNRSNDDHRYDNIYEVVITKRSFPLTVEGKISYKRSAQVGSNIEKIAMSDAKLELIDKENKNVVREDSTDQQGNFKIEIPYKSQYLLKVSQRDFGTAVVSMDIPENYQDHITHDIVIMEDLFK